MSKTDCDNEAVELALDYLNDLVYGGDPERRESLRGDATFLAKQIEFIAIKDILAQVAAHPKPSPGAV